MSKQYCSEPNHVASAARDASFFLITAGITLSLMVLAGLRLKEHLMRNYPLEEHVIQMMTACEREELKAAQQTKSAGDFLRYSDLYKARKNCKNRPPSSNEVERIRKMQNSALGRVD